MVTSSAIPVGINVQVESIDSISEVNMDFTMTLYLRHYWKDERLAFPSRNNKSRTFDARLVKKIWVPDVFFVHSKHAYNENDLMLYWKNGNDSLRTDEIVLSQFFIEEFHSSNGLAFYSSTGWYNRLYINFILRRHIFFFMLQTYFPTMLMVLLSWVSFWIDRRAVPARVSLGMTTVLTMSTIITGVSSSMPQIPSTFNASQAMAFDGCFHDDEIELTSYPGTVSGTMTSDPRESPPPSLAGGEPPTVGGGGGVRLRRQRSLREHVDLLLSNSYMIDSYSRLAFPLSYLLFNVVYWSLYS
ncbi:hypothetical protein CRUP_010685 [Coryphaenoides rupestris]|nr:hypothetical protein CRUP_010685 [Coryphaenoides rupestris]